MRAITLTLHPSVDRILELKTLKPGGLADARLLLTVPAGKGINTARSLSAVCKSPRQVLALAWAGADKAAWFESWLAKHNGIGAVCCLRKCETRFSHTLLEESGRETHIKESMQAPSHGEQSALVEFCNQTFTRDAVLAFCGSAPQGTSASTLTRLFALARKKTAIVIADANGLVLQIAGDSALNGIKGNALEIGAWLGLPGSFELARNVHRRRLSERFSKTGAPKSVLITFGAAGAMLATGEHIFFASPPALSRTARSATGCGDAATAGWMWALSEGAPPEECLRRAVACGTAKLASADPGKLDAQLVRQLLRVTKVNDE